MDPNDTRHRGPREGGDAPQSADEGGLAKDRQYRGPAPQGGKGTPDQAEGEPEDVQDDRRA